MKCWNKPHPGKECSRQKAQPVRGDDLCVRKEGRGALNGSGLEVQGGWGVMRILRVASSSLC